MVETEKKVKRYEHYKDSGVEWLGEIPEHWEMKKVKFISEIFNGDSLNESLKKKYESDDLSHLAYISSKDINVNSSVITYDNGLRIPKDGAKLKVAPKSSSLLCIEGGSAGRKIAFTNQEVCFVNKLACFAIKKGDNSQYLFFSLKGSPFQTQFKLSMSGMIGGVAISSINNFSIPIPPLKEQTAIATFLDDKTTKIDEAIAIKEQQISLLKERKQILIHKAVTQGLNPNVKLKDSGVEWIGEIPEGWEVKRLKHCLNINNGSDYKHIQTDEGYPVIGSGGQFAYASEYMYDGEVVFLGRKGTIDKPLYFKGKFWAVDTMFYANAKNGNIVKFLYYLATTLPFSYYSTATALPSMTQSDLNNHPISLPSIEEQQKIIDYIETASQKIETAIGLKQQEIDKLKEYKSSLINSVVTGKVKVV